MAENLNGRFITRLISGSKFLREIECNQNIINNQNNSPINVNAGERTDEEMNFDGMLYLK